MKQFGLIIKLVVGIFAGLLIGLYADEWRGTQWLIHVVVFGKTFLKDVIQFFLPLIMISFIGVGIGELGKNAGKMLNFTVGLSYLYTVTACVLGAVVIVLCFTLFPAMSDVAVQESAQRELPKPIVNLRIPYPFSESLMTSIVLGFVLGIGISWTQAETLIKLLREVKAICYAMIKKVIIPLIPFYIACVFAQIAYVGDIGAKIHVLSVMLILIVILQWIWLLIQYSLAGLYTQRNPFPVMKTMFPAYLTAMGTMSSAVTMPVSLERGKTIPFMKRDIADFVFPLCSQTHLSGTAVTISISAVTVSLLTTGQVPGLLTFGLFILLLSVVLVGAVGVPGGSIIAAWPVLVGVLGFGDEAMGMMFALFMIQDSFGTAANITGDGSIAMIVNKKFSLEKSGSQP